MKAFSSLLLLFCLLAAGALPGSALDRAAVGDADGQGDPSAPAPDLPAGGAAAGAGRRLDGLAEFLSGLNTGRKKLYEEYDFNQDGRMDDFYYYEAGRLVRQEIDTNFDGRIDLWVFLVQGIYIQRYERDTDFDGKVDVVRRFGRP